MNRMSGSMSLPSPRRNIVRSSKPAIAGLVTTLLVTGGLGLAGLGLAAGAAQADPGLAQFPQFHGPVPAKARGPYQWCPGQHLPTTDTHWDMSVCHTWYYVDYGWQANVGTGVYEGDNPPPDLGCIPIICLPGL